MIRARQSLDRWAQYAHYLLDKAQRGLHVKGEYIDWALAYLGDTNGSIKLPSAFYNRLLKAVTA